MYRKYTKPAVYNINSKKRWLCLPKDKYYSDLSGDTYIFSGLATIMLVILFFAVWLISG